MTIVVAGYIDLEIGADRACILAGGRPFIEAAWDEAGCVAYDWTPDPFKENRIHVFEEWEDVASLQVHLEGKPYLDMLGHLRGAGIIGAKTQKYRVDLIEPVYDETGVPRADFFTDKPS